MKYPLKNINIKKWFHCKSKNIVWNLFFIFLFFIICLLFFFSLQTILKHRFNEIFNLNLNVNLNLKEGFEWSEKSKQDFLLVQDTLNHQKVFDLEILQQQASQEEVEYFNKHGKWQWSQKTKDLYMNAINKNPYIRTLSSDALNHAMTIYNESAILLVLSQQTKEGRFLIDGVLVPNINNTNNTSLLNGFGDFGYNSGLQEEEDTYDIIQCNLNSGGIERTQYGKEKRSSVDYNDLEKVIPGFTFLNGSCNPCVAFNETPDYSCPFELKLKDKNGFQHENREKNREKNRENNKEKEKPMISQIWQTLWNISN
jgi:hypothetical protein